MAGLMPGLGEFRYDEGVPGDDVYLAADDGTLALRRKAEVLAQAQARGWHLYEQWPAEPGQLSVCDVGPLTVPPRWEAVADAEPEGVDEELGFEGSCGGTDYLLGNGHTHTGRIQAWCPQRGLAYRVSAGSLRGLSDAGRYWVRGFLHGAEPGPPRDDEGDLVAEDVPAWEEATRRFRGAGTWSSRWQVCTSCGAVRVPGADGATCSVHDS